MKAILPAILWALIIFVLCAIPGRDIPHVSFLEMLSFDKWVHAGIFFVLVVLSIRGFRLQGFSQVLKSKSVWIAVLFGVIYGGSLEIMQATCFSERSADLYDFIANSFGCIMAAILYKRIAVKFIPLKLPLT
jgi:VanZ family protein